MKQLQKCAAFTDIHWGCKLNSDQHNQDCLDYVDWFSEKVKSDPSIDHIMFLGDWFENRSALNISTLNWSYKGAKKINDLNLPVFFMIGNHDLYHRHTRELYSPIHFHEFKNFNIINEVTVMPQIGNGALLCPYLFHEEYPNLINYAKLDTWWGHFEFKGFLVTGYNVVMPTGPDPDDFKDPKHIVSGHFHKRQANNNVVYMGNTFPTSFSDTDDFSRGMMIYDHYSDKLEFHDWAECPKYIKTNLSSILDGAVLPQHSRVKCIIDVPISFEESTELKQAIMEEANLREFTMEESTEITEAFTNTKTDATLSDIKVTSINDLVIQMLNDIKTEHIDKNMLVQIYQDIKT